MADHALPTTGSTYSNYTNELDGRLDDLAVGMDPAVVTATNVPPNSIRWTSASGKWQKYVGATWVDLSSAYQIAITGNAGTATALQTARAINGVNFDGSAAVTVEPFVEQDLTTAATRYLTFVDSSTAGHQRLNIDTDISYNPSTNTLTVPNLAGNAATATTAAACSGNAATATSATSATNATNVAVTDDTTTNATYYPALATTNSGNVAPRVSSTKLTFNPSTGQLAAVSFAGAGTGLTGTAASLLAGGLSSTLAVAGGGTGGTTAAAARSSLGAAASGANTDITSLAAITSINGGQLAGFRNRIINGACQFTDYGTTGVLAATLGYASLNRFAFSQSGSSNGTAVQISTGLPTGFKHGMSIGRTAVSGFLGDMNIGQALETAESIPLQGQTVALSFYAKAGANFSAASSQMGIVLTTGTGTDQSVASMIGGWTGAVSAINATQVITTSWVRYSFTATLGASITQVGVLLKYTPTGTAGADDNIYITGVQLEVGAVATPFEHRPYGVELALCQRYYQVVKGGTGAPQFRAIGTGLVSSSGGGLLFYVYPVAMRSSPVCSYSGTVYCYDGSATPTMSTITTQYAGEYSAYLAFTVSSSVLTIGRALAIYCESGTSNYVQFVAEL